MYLHLLYEINDMDQEPLVKSKAALILPNPYFFLYILLRSWSKKQEENSHTWAFDKLSEKAWGKN